tara:strand:- start:245 stop:520 length:276 start_codon:yes stop_codon:yes gene_type:complete
MRLAEKYSHGAQLATKYGGHAERLGQKIGVAGKYVGMVHQPTGEKITQVGEAVSQVGKVVGGIASATGQVAGLYSKLPTRGYQESWKTVGR